MLNRILKSKWLTPIVAAALSLVAFGLVEVFPRYLANQNEIKSLQNKIGESEKSAKNLEKTKELAGSESYLELLARLKLNFKKPDEKVVFVYKSSYTGQAETPTPSASPTPGFWEKITNWIKGN